MKMLILIDEKVQTEALQKARLIGGDSLLAAGVLNAPLGGEALDWITKIWDEMEIALKSAYRNGIEAARPIIDRVSVLTQEVNAKLLNSAEEIRIAVSAKLSDYVQTMIDGALLQVRPTIIVGGRELHMSSVTIEQKIGLSGSIKVALHEVCEFVAKGELSLSSEYTISLTENVA
jgi:hypothetical protein